MLATAPRLSNRAIVAIGMMAAAVIGFAGINAYLPGGGDNAAYIAEAEAWLTLGHRANFYEVGTPVGTVKPPLFSLLVAGVEFFFGRNVAAMKAMVVLFAVGSVWAAYWALSEGLSPHDGKDENSSRIAALISLWFAFAPSLTLYTHDVLSDVPFTFFALLTAGFLIRAARENSSFLHVVGAIVALISGSLLRSTGLIIAGAGVGCLAIEFFFAREKNHRRQLLVRTMVFTVAMFALFAANYARLHGHEMTQGPVSAAINEAVGDSSIAARITRVFQYYVLFQPAEVAAYAGFGPNPAIYALAVVGLLILLVGAAVLWSRGKRMIPVFWALHQGALLFWPYIDARFYLPTLPFYLCLFYFGARTILEKLWRKNAALGWSAAFVFAIFPAVSLIGTAIFFGDELPGGATSIEWISGLVVAILLLLGVKYRNKDAPRERMQSGAYSALCALFLALVVCRSLSENVVRERGRTAAPPGTGWQEFYEVSEWLGKNAAPDEGVVSAKPSLLWLWSGRRGISIPFKTDHEEMKRALAPARWIVLDALEEDRAATRFLAPFIQAESGNWVKRLELEKTTVWQRKAP